MKKLLQIIGTWKSIDTTDYRGTEVVIIPTGKNTFDIDIDAFHISAFGAIHTGNIFGKGEVKDTQIEFIVDENLKGEIRLQNGKLLINYIGDTTHYGGIGVSFASEFAR